MGRPLDYAVAEALLERTFNEAEAGYRENRPLKAPEEIVTASETLLKSSTQAFREAMIGCVLARILDPEIDISRPYMKQGATAFNGRTLDERVVNPFLRRREIPCSTGPYLTALRRNVTLTPGTAKGLRDKEAFLAMIQFLRIVAKANAEVATDHLRYLLGGFLKLRESANILLDRPARLSVEQYGKLLQRLLALPSGGLWPVLLSVAMFHTLRDCHGLDWRIEWQGINVADRASGVAGDITIRRKGVIELAVEVSERPVGGDRVVYVFRSKISPQALKDYMFLFTASPPTEDARAAARQYFAAGHEINFVPIREWIVTLLATIGPSCRTMFTGHIIELLKDRTVPAALRVTWNEQLQESLA